MKTDLCVSSRTKHLIFCILLAAAAAYVIFMCPYRFVVTDEAFFLTIPMRLFQGDALFQHEWHLSQLASMLTLPFVSLYLMLQGNTEGIVLAMRYFGAFVQLCVAVFVYIRFQRFHWLGALIASLCLLLYTPFNSSCLLYPSLGIYSFILCFTIVCTARKAQRLQYTVAGLFLAAGVLCCPYMAFAFALYLIFVFLKEKIVGNRDMERYPIFSPMCAVYMTLGAAIAAGLFLIFTLSRASLSAILASIPYILDDPEHIYVSMWMKALNFFLGFFFAGPNIPELYCAMAALFVLHCIDRKRQQHDPLYIGIAAGITIAIIVIQYSRFHYVNHTMWPINIFALFLVLITNDKTARLFFHTFWLPGMAYAFCYQMASNQDFYATAAGSSVATVGSVFITVLVLHQQLRSLSSAPLSKIAVGMICLLLTAQVFFQVYARCYLFFLQPEPQNAHCVKVEDGCCKGLLVSRNMYHTYYDQMEDVALLKERGFRKMLFLSDSSWYYLFDNFEICTYSTWLSGVNDHTLLRLQAYYTINPEKLPDAVLVEFENREYGEKFCEIMDYHMEETEGFLLLLPNT